ncbi:MAG: tRNA preQ1(34) S-adenosylmethionine ribosyltransferase-isomerase QueA [Oscillospiraceae bacterium]|jgi:S-adenosylmethionine:tRNA ribosyltransferase-isomerase|nr:tRNA preQ1(34) S-adenosylmethionine ribosyltransferase-isomerase QueA [Oscillospiraceae bacterium]
MKTAGFAYDLPEELIAQTPAERRDGSRLMVLDRKTGGVRHRFFYDLPEFLRHGDCLVVNNSRVLPARLAGRRENGGAAEVLLLRDLGGDRWKCLVKPGKSLRTGARVVFGGDRLTGVVEDMGPGGERIVRFAYGGGWDELLRELGAAPLPPYIRRKPPDSERYQTVYAKPPGSAAAPTAGLHFTAELLDRLRGMGVQIAEITLHVGLGTFQPVTADDVRDHVMHTEWYEIPGTAAETVNRARAAGGRIVAVGTTSCRTLESAVSPCGKLLTGSGETGIFITPGYSFRMTDALITNFHLPQSTLLMLVSAFCTREMILSAYGEAIRERYRFFSFGDAMLIV